MGYKNRGTHELVICFGELLHEYVKFGMNAIVILLYMTS